MGQIVTLRRKKGLSQRDCAEDRDEHRQGNLIRQVTKDVQHGESLGVKTGGVAQRLSSICQLGAALDRK